MKRTAIAAGVAAVLAGTAHAAVTEFVIYKEPNFRGASHTVKGEVANLEGFAREGASLLVKGGYWEVCTDDHFKGHCRTLEAGEYPRLARDLDQRIVSVRFLGDNAPKAARHEAREYRIAMVEDRRSRWDNQWEERWAERRERRDERWDDRHERWHERHADRSAGALDLYARPGFRGRSMRVEDDAPNLWGSRFDGRASSVIVHEGTWQLCSEPRFEGVCGVFRPGEYAHLAGLDDRVSSLRRLR